MKKTYCDVGIIGCGEAGIFAAYELSRLNPGLKIVVCDQGADIYSRHCPIVAGKVRECIHCKTCDTMCGFGGAGAFSDGKFNFTTQFGGWLTDFMDEAKVMELIEYVDSVNMRFGATDQRFTTSSPEAQALEREALRHDLHLLQASCKHLGTENNLIVLTHIYEYLKDKAEFRFCTPVEHIERSGDGYAMCLADERIECRYLAAGPGRSGAEWFSKECRAMGLKLINNQVDLGVRVELPAKVFSHITDVVYESKLVYRTKQYGDSVRTFCMNPYGYVVTENVEGINTVNGHSYSDPSLRSENTNFALLVSNRFTEPFDEPYRYGKHIASLSNMLAGGVLVQRFGDLVKGSRTNAHRLKQSFVKPTLTAAVPGDLSLALPKRQLDDIIEMIYALDKIAPGTANYDTLLYGAEVKFYSSRLELSGELETKLPGFFAMGDGAGITRGLAQAGASGIRVARAIAERLQVAEGASE
ncbi:MAG: NAD(P)/FAD-dependent oxidoreductase [Firmicutes bacterium]|nr:NAD(P)/FAD-dependent oxidoreductase [Bacillota bacterium]